MNVDPKMWPPERGFRREANAASESLSAFEKIIRYAEKDDLLLYLTALFGVVMPAVMYFVYKAAHSRYQVYAKRRKLEKKAEKAKQREITIFYLGTEAATRRIAYAFAEHVLELNPVVVALVPERIRLFLKYKGVAVFLVPDVEPVALAEDIQWFFDWLQEMRFEAKVDTLLSQLKYAILSVTQPKQELVKGKIHNMLTKRLDALHATQLQGPNFIVQTPDDGKETDESDPMEIQLEGQATLFAESVRAAFEDSDSELSDIMLTDDDEAGGVTEYSEVEEEEDRRSTVSENGRFEESKNRDSEPPSSQSNDGFQDGDQTESSEPKKKR